jgi:hypothetical protein
MAEGTRGLSNIQFEEQRDGDAGVGDRAGRECGPLLCRS